MFSAVDSLHLLETALGDQVHLLKYPPLHQVVTGTLNDDPEAVSFKILLGYIRNQQFNVTEERLSYRFEENVASRNKEELWIHLYHAEKPGKMPEIQFHAYEVDGDYVAKHDSETITRLVSGYAAAFTLPTGARWSRGKLMAIAKYYFLRKLAETDNETDRKKMEFGIPFTKSFKEDLKNACREFEKSKHDKNTVASGVTDTKQLDVQEGYPTDTPIDSLEEDDVTIRDDTSFPIEKVNAAIR
jgi:hypothetical protein